jgi:hypothetical protein
MAATAIATYQTIWDCKWSRILAMPVPEPPNVWVCIRRDGPPRRVGEEECATCPFWEATDEREC